MPMPSFIPYIFRCSTVRSVAAKFIPIIEACVKNNAAGPEMLGVLRDDYKMRNGSENGYEEYLQKLKSSAHLQAMQEEIEENIVKLPIELFAMKDLDGNTVDLSRMKGKILVLDFWATWCAPCKASFPGMQMAVDKYADDENVEFFFIATMETNPDYKAEIRKFLKSKGFNMMYFSIIRLKVRSRTMWYIPVIAKISISRVYLRN